MDGNRRAYRGRWSGVRLPSATDAGRPAIAGMGRLVDGRRLLAAPGRPLAPPRVRRIDRGWSSLLPEGRVRNLGASVAVGDWVCHRTTASASSTCSPVGVSSCVGPPSRCRGNRSRWPPTSTWSSSSMPDDTAEPAARTGARPGLRQRRRAGDRAEQVDLVDDPHASVVAAEPIALSAPVYAASGRTGAGLDRLADLAGGHRTIALLGASGVGKSTLVNGLVGRDVQDTGAVREQDDRGRHTTTAAELVGLPGGGWLIDTPGLRAVSLLGEWPGDRAGVPGRVRPRRALPLPGLQARG